MGYIKRQNVILGTLLGFAFVSPTFAQSEPGFYLGVGIGPTLVSDVDLELRSGGASETASLSAEPGVRFDLAPGYRVNENLAVEFNTGVLWNGLDEVEAGELMIIRGSGAYGATMANTYNSRPLVPEVLVNGGDWAIVRERQELEALMRYDKVPSWLSSGR